MTEVNDKFVKAAATNGAGKTGSALKPITQSSQEMALMTGESASSDGKTQAVNDAKAYMLAYAKTTQGLAPILDEKVRKARRQMSEAVSSGGQQAIAATEEEDTADFLLGVSSELDLLLG